MVVVVVLHGSAVVLLAVSRYEGQTFWKILVYRFCVVYIKGEALMCNIGAWISNKSHMSPTLNRSCVLQCFKHSNVVRIHNGIMFDFYLGLPYMLKVPKLSYS